MLVVIRAARMSSARIPNYLRSDSRSEFTAETIREWLNRFGVKTLFIEPGSPWENGYLESFNGKMRDELLNGEIFDTIYQARVITELWRKEYNQTMPHSSLNYRPPAPEVTLPAQSNQLNWNRDSSIIHIGI